MHPTLLLLFLAFSGLSAQTTFQRYYNICGDGRGIAAYETDEGYLIFGETYASQTCFSLLLIDSLGNEIRSKEFDFSPDGHFDTWGRVFQVDDNGDYWMLGSISPPVITNWRTTIFKISGKTWDILFQKTLDSVHYEKPKALVRSNQGTFFLVSERNEITEGPNWRYISDADIVIRKLDTNGDIIKEKILEKEKYFAYPGDLMLLESSGDVAITLKDGDDYLLAEPYVALLDSNFNFKWKRELPEVIEPDLRPVLSVSEQEGLIHVGYKRKVILPGYGFIYSYDLDGNMVREIPLPAYSVFSIADLKVVTNNNILGDGADDLNGDSSGRIFRMKSNGEILWDRRYRIRNLTWDLGFFNYAMETKDGGVLAVGFMINFRNNEPDIDIYVLKVDGNGCLTPACNTIEEPGTYVSTKNQFLENTGIKIYPNPAKEQLYLEGESLPKEISIVTINGKTVKTQANLTAQQQVILEISELHPGIYLLRLLFEDGRIHFEKFVKN
ncbi:MAG TPA: T9SS type A sorting domain-containing protein [Saprospiraceae bacterium]|nr:T9SS type A sorting domain-containing protein [Saprospiraceae bacterium]